MRLTRAKLSLILLSIGLLYSASSVGGDYKVEVVIFKPVNADPPRESLKYQAIPPAVSASETWYIEPELLVEEVNTLRESPDYEVLHHLSWAQESLPYEASAAMSFHQDELIGWVKIYAKTLLFAHLNLDIGGYRIQEKRRLKLNEKHYFDHPRYGVLLQVSRLEYEQDNDVSLDQ